MKNKVVIFIDQVAAKNKLQMELLQQFGFEPFCFVTHFRPGSEIYFTKGKQVELLKGFFKRWGQLFSFFRKNHKSIHHIELYPGGRFTFIYVLLSKLFSLKTLCIERGDLTYYHKNGYSAFTRFSMWCCYRFSTMIWYRELFMKPLLEKIRKNGLFFLHNALDSKDSHYDPSAKRDIDFLWMNRVVPERKYQWFLNILKEKAFQSTSNYLVGIMPSSTFSADQDYVINNKPSNLHLAEYTNDPVPYFRRARFFVFPAEAVFANNALLEAMSYGVVPLISRQQGAELIVDDHVNGFIFQHTMEGMELAMQEALQLTSQQYDAFSMNAARKIRDSFSEKKYSDSLNNLYRMLD